MKIYDGDRLIRSLKKKVPDSTGLYRWQWYMNEAGVDWPSRKIRKRKNEPGGVAVKPGNYLIKLSYLEQQSEASITIKSDPRVNVSSKAINETYQVGKELERMTQTAADAVKQLIESKETANQFKSDLQKEDKEKFKEQIKLSKELVKKIDSILALYIGKEDKRQGITSSPEVTLMQRISTANWYSGSRPNGITNTEETLMTQAKDQLETVLNTTNSFYKTEWKEYQIKMENIKLSIFKKIKTFNTN